MFSVGKQTFIAHRFVPQLICSWSIPSLHHIFMCNESSDVRILQTRFWTVFEYSTIVMLVSCYVCLCDNEESGDGEESTF